MKCINFDGVTAVSYRQKWFSLSIIRRNQWFGQNIIYQMIFKISCFGLLFSIFRQFSTEILPLVNDIKWFPLYKKELMDLDEISYIK